MAVFYIESGNRNANHILDNPNSSTTTLLEWPRPHAVITHETVPFSIQSPTKLLFYAYVQIKHKTLTPYLAPNLQTSLAEYVTTNSKILTRNVHESLQRDLLTYMVATTCGPVRGVRIITFTLCILSVSVYVESGVHFTLDSTAQIIRCLS